MDADLSEVLCITIKENPTIMIIYGMYLLEDQKI